MKLYVKKLSGESQAIEVTKGKLTKVVVTDNSKYQFIDDTNTKSKKNKLLKTKRVGENLEVYFEGDTEPSLVLENYFAQMQTPPMIYNESGELLSESGFINLASDVDALFLLTTDNTLLYGGLAVVAGGGIAIAASGGGGSSDEGGSSKKNETSSVDITPPSLDKDTDVASTGTPTEGIDIVTTLPSNVVVGDKVTTVLKDSLGTVIQTIETVVTANDIQEGTITQEIGILSFGTYTTLTSMIDAAGNESEVAEFSYNNNLSGQLQDDYIADAFVFIDSNNNGIWDVDEEWTQTDSNGRFEFKTNPNGAPIVAMGGIDTASGTPNIISYKMYLDATTQQVGGDVIMSPLSTLIAAVADAQAQSNGNQEITQEDLIAAVETIGQVFGIDIQDPVAILNYDFVASSSGENATAFDKDFLSLNRQIAVVLSTTTALIDGAAATTNSDVDANILGKGTLAVTESIANLILEKSSTESTMDLTSSPDIKTIIENSMTISNESELTSDLRASNEADLTTLSDVIAGFNTKIDEQTNLDPQSDDAKATIRTVTEVLVPILTTSGSQAQTERGGDISLSDSLTGLTTEAANVNTYITNQIETVKTENKPFLANDVEGIAGQLTKIVLQMPTLGVGDSVDKLYISKETNGNLSVELFTVNPLTKETNELTQEIEIDGRTYLVIDPSKVGFLYVKSSAITEDYLDVIAYNTVDGIEKEYDDAYINGVEYINYNLDVKISMTDPLVLPTITITKMEDNAPAITGTISKDGVTNDSTPTMTGTLSEPIPDGYTLKVFNNDGSLVDVTSLDGLNWSYTSSELIDGNQALSIAIVSDDNKIMYAVNPYGFVVDTVTATPIINQTDGKVINGTAEIGSTVTIKAGSTVIGTAMTDSNGKWSLTVSSQVADETSLTATAVDRAGNSATSSSVTVQWGVPTTLVTITSVIDDLKTLTDNSYTSDSTPTISGTLSALLKENEVLSIFNGESKIGEAIVTGQTWTFTPITPLIDGTYPLSAKVDNGAEQGVTSSVFTLNIDTVAPTQNIEITSVMDDVVGVVGQIEENGITNDSKPTFNGTISSQLNPNESIVAYIGTTKIGVATVTDTSWTFIPSIALSDGEKNIQFVVEDKAGNKSTEVEYTFTVDTIAPTLNLQSNSLITSIQEGDSETIICSVTATNGAILSMKSGSADSDLFEVSSDGKVTAKSGLDYESKTTYTFTIVATDEVGNSKEITASIAVTDATEAPKIISVEPSSLANYETSVEGETVEVSFIVKRTDSTGTATVSWETSGISAQDFENGELPSGEVTFANGETSKTVTILVPASLTQEQLRTLEISLFDASEGYSIDETNGSATVNIVDYSSVEIGTRFTVLADNSVISEGAEGETKDITYTIVRSGDLSQSLTISYSITPSGAALVSGDDFGLQNLPSGNIIFEEGSDTATVTISVQGDNDVGPDEQFNFVLGNLPANSKVLGNTIGKIINDDAYISVIPQEIENATTGEVTHKFIIIRTGDTSTSHTLTYTISSTGENGTDLFNTDEEITITFKEGETEKEISFQTTGDEVINGYKSFGIELFVSEDSNVTLLNKTAISTINPNVQDVKIEANIDRLLEGSSEEFIYTVTRSGNISEALEIPWSLEPSAENGVDVNDFIGNVYPSGILIFAEGETTATIQFSSTQDSILEGDEGFNIVLDNASLPEYIRLINPSIEGVIVDDESAVGFATNAQFKAIEADIGTTDLVITVTRVGFTGNPSTVDWALSFGNEENSATLADLMQNQATSGTVTFKPGEATATITIKVAGDVDFEDGLNEVFDVTLSNPSAGTKLIGGTGENGVIFDGYSNVTTATIINDDSLIKVETSTVDYLEKHGGTSDYVAITILREGSTAGSDWVKWSLTSNGDSNSANNTDLGQENDAITVFDDYSNSWIDFATLSGTQSADGAITITKDGYVMVSYDRDWSYDDNTTPIDQFILNNLSINGGTITSLGSVSNENDILSTSNTIGLGDKNNNWENANNLSGVVNTNDGNIVVKSDIASSDSTIIIHGGISVGVIQNGIMAPSFGNTYENTTTLDTPTKIQVENVSFLFRMLDEFFAAMDQGEITPTQINYFKVTGLDADGEEYSEVVAVNDLMIFSIDGETPDFGDTTVISEVVQNENLLTTPILKDEAQMAGRVALSIFLFSDGGDFSEAEFTITGIDALGNIITDKISGPYAQGEDFSSSTVLSNKYFASITSIESNSSVDAQLFVSLTKPAQTQEEFSVVDSIIACDENGNPLEAYAEGGGRFEFTAPMTIEVQGVDAGLSILDTANLTYVDYVEVIKDENSDANVKIGYIPSSYSGEDGESMLVLAENGSVSTIAINEDNYSNLSYAIFKVDLSNPEATLNFDINQLGRYGIDIGKLSYSPSGTFSSDSDDMKYENEGSNLLIPALTSPLLINVLGIDAFTNENYYSIEDIEYFYIDEFWDNDLYFNEGTQENPNWVYFWNHTSNVESYDVSVQDITNGKIGFSGSKIGIYAYPNDGENEYDGIDIYTGVYTALSIDDFSGNYDLNSAEYVYFDSIPSENFYINTSETSTPNWVNVYNNEGYVSVQDIIDGKLAYLGSSKDFEAYIYDNNENELLYIENIQYHILSVKELATDNDEGEWYTGYEVGADQIRVYDDGDIEGTLYYNNGTSENPDWIEYNYYIDEYNDGSEYHSIQDAIDGKFAYSGEEVSLRVNFYTDGDDSSSIYPYIQASGNASSEIATQTGEVALDGSGYIWVRYDNNDNSGNDGADQAWINNLHLIDPSGLATIEVVGQKVIKDGVAHEQELSSESGTLNLDGIAVKNTPLVTNNTNTLIAITTGGNKISFDITDTNGNDREVNISKAGSTTLTALNVSDAEKIVYGQYNDKNLEDTDTISIVQGNLSSIASNTKVFEVDALNIVSLESLISKFGVNQYMDEYEYTISDMVYVYFDEWWTNNDSDDLYFNKGTVENPQWVSFNGGNILAQDIIDGKLAYSGEYLGIYYPEFSFDENWDDYYTYYSDRTIYNPTNIVSLEDLSRAVSTSVDEIAFIEINYWSADDDLFFNKGTIENPQWIEFGDYKNEYFNANNETYPILTKQDILDGKLAYTGNYLNFYDINIYSQENVYAKDIYDYNISGEDSYYTIYDQTQTHTLTLADLEKSFDIKAGDIDYINLYWASADNNLYVNIGTKETSQWVNFNYHFEGDCELTVQDILDGKVIYTGDYLEIGQINIYDKNGDSLVSGGSAYIDNSLNVVTLEDIATMYGNNFSADEIGTVYINSWNVDYNLWYNSGTVQEPYWERYSDYYYFHNYSYPTLTAQDIVDGKLAYEGDYLKVSTYIRDVNDNYLVDYYWGDYIYATVEVNNPNTFETIEIYDATDGSLVGDEPYFMHSVATYEFSGEDSASLLGEDSITLNGELLTFTSDDDLSDRTITISGYIEGSEDLVIETITTLNNQTVVSTNRFVSVTSIQVSSGANDASLSVGKSIVFENAMTLFAKSDIADADGEITITGLDANNQIQTITYENILDGITKSVGVFKEIFAIETANMNDGKIEFSAVEGDGFTGISLNGTRDNDGYIVFAEAQRVTITNNDSNAQNQEFRITGLDEDGNEVIEIVEGLDSNGSYVSTHYFSKLLNIESGLVNGSSISNISIGTVGAPIIDEQVMSEYGSEVAVNDSVAIFDTPSQITFSSDDDLTSRIFTVTGTNAQGETVVENVTGSNNGLSMSATKFMTVTSITVDDGAVGSVKVGFTTSGGLTDNFVVTGSGTEQDPFVGYSTNKSEGTESDVLLFVNFNGASAGSVKLSYDLAVQGSVNEDTLYVEYSSNILSLLQGKTYFEDGDSETTILIPVLGDDTKEANEDMTLVLTGSSTGTTIVDDERTTEITIVNDDDLVTLDSTPVVLKEGDDSQTPNTLRFTVLRDASNTEKEVFWHIENITSEDNDFASITGSVIFAVGELETYIDVVLTSDRIQEGTENFNLVLSTPQVGSGYSLSGSTTAAGTIVEDDVAISIVANDVSKVEGATDSETTYTFTVTRTGDTTQASNLVWNVAGDVANIPYGFDATTGTLDFAADELEKIITIKTTGNDEMNGDRPFTVTVSNAQGDTSDIKVATATSTMIEDDAINLSILSTEIKQIEATGTTKTFTYTITRADNESSYEASYNWAVILEGDGVNPVASAADFVNSIIPSGNIAFAADEKTKTITFEVANDSILEADEAFKLRFEAANASEILDQDITAYIVNDTVAYSIEVKANDVAVDTAVKEGDSENKTITVTFVRAGNSENEATLTYSIEGTTANVISADDFVDMQTLPTDETIIFEAGQSTVTKTFTLKADSVKEENESFKVVLKDAQTTEVATKTVQVTNDDAGLVLEVSQSSITEGTYAANSSVDARYTTLTYTVYRSGDTTDSSEVSWKVNEESGITIDDFVGATDSLGTNNGLPSGTITFDANDIATYKTFTINVAKDWKYEGASENLVVELFDASVGTGITTATVTTTILDDDKEVGFSVGTITQTVTEGSPTGTEMVNSTEYLDITYTVVRTGNDRDGTQTITWSLSGLEKEGYDAATVDSYSSYYNQWNNNDVVALDSNGNRVASGTGTLVFENNADNEKTITIRVHKDHYQENPEAFKITLSNPTEGLSVSETSGVAEGIIEDDDIALSLSSDSAKRVVKAEGQLDGNENTVYTEYTWVIERTGLEAAVDLDWSVQGHSIGNMSYVAANGQWVYGTIPSATVDSSDFDANTLSGTLQFGENETSKTLTIRVVGDAVVESTETFKVVFAKPTNVGDISDLGNWYVGNPTTSYAEGIILRDEGRFGIESYELDINSAESFDNDEYDTLDVSSAKAEGDDGYVSHFFKIYRDFTTSGDATIEWRVENGWVNSVEDDYPFLDHDTSTSADTSDFVDGQNSLDGTTLPSGIATIADGEEYTIIEIKTKGDISAEDLNSFVVRLSNPSSGSTLDVNNETSMGYIANDDNPLFSIGQIIPTEGSEATYGSKVVTEGDTVTYRVYRSGSTAYEADIDWQVAFPDEVTNALNSDYKADASDFDTLVLSGTLNFGVGESYKEITLNIKDDTTKEAWAEAFSIELSNARWADSVPTEVQNAKTPAISQVAGTMESIIIDNEAATSVVSVSAVNNATDGFEGGLGGDNTITYTLTRSGDTTTAAQIGWTLRTPDDRNDYSNISGDTVAQTHILNQEYSPWYAVGLVSFGANETTKTITLTYNADSNIEDNENFVFTLIDGKTILESGWDTWMAPWYYGTGNDGTSNANKYGIDLLDANGRIPDSADMYVDSENATATTEVKNDDGRIKVNNTYTSTFNTFMGEHIYEGDSGDIVFTADITRYGRIDHDVTITYNLVDSSNNVVATGTWALAGDTTNTNGNGSKDYTMDFVLGTGNTTVEADKTYTLQLSNVSDSNILFSQGLSLGVSTTQNIPVTVLNDDTTWSIGATTLIQVESDDFQDYTFTITRPSNEYTGAADVTYQIVVNGATYTIDENDIVNGLGERTVSFAAGETSKVVTFRVNGDQVAERNESFNVELVSATKGQISDVSKTLTYTIVNDDTTVEIVDASAVLEGDVDGAYLEFDVIRKGQIENNSSSVTWTVQDGSATITDDLTSASDKTGSLSFDEGQTNISEVTSDGYGEQTQKVRVYIKGDTTVEADQYINVSLSNATDSDGINTQKVIAKGTILNDESIFTLTAGVSVVEGNVIGQKFTITRSAVTGQAQTIDWAVSSEGNSHSVSANDMLNEILANGSVIFAPNELVKEIFVKSASDDVAELDEVFIFTISVANGTTGATIEDGKDVAYGTVVNDDEGEIVVQNPDSTIAIDGVSSGVEGDTGTSYVEFTLTRGGVLNYDASVSWHIELIDSEADLADFGGTLPSGTLELPLGETAFTIQVPISGDSTYEANEKFKLVIDTPEPGLEITVDNAEGTITNDDALISIVDNVVVNENGTATFTLSRTGVLTESNTVNWNITAGENVLGTNDISTLSGTATFAADSATTTVTISMNNDYISEADEVFNFTLSNPSEGSSLDLENSSKTLTITNDDADKITYTVTPLSQNEGDGDSWTTYSVTVSRENPTTSVSVDWSVTETTFENLSDIVFEAENGTVTFEGTSLTATFDIKVKTDDIGDFDKYFDLDLTNAVTNDVQGAYVNTSKTELEVLNDDPAFRVDFTSNSFVEGSGTNTKLVTFTISRSGDLSGTASLDWAISTEENSFNPVNISDFGGYWPTGTTVFADGESVKTIQVAIAPDAVFEPSESFKVEILNLVSQTASARIIVNSDTAVITNDDIGVSVEASVDSINEGTGEENTNVTFTLSAQGVANKTVTTYFVIEGTDLSPIDEFDGEVNMDSFSSNYGNSDYFSYGYDEEKQSFYVQMKTDSDGYAESTFNYGIFADNIAGANETLRVRITEVVGGTIDNSEATVEIVNDDTAISSIVNTTLDIKEGNTGTKTYTFEVTRSGSTISSAQVAYEILGFGDNQANSSDFSGQLSGNVIFEAGSATATIEVVVSSDTVFESDEGFIVVVAPNTPNEARLDAVIKNDDLATLEVNGIVTSVKEGTENSNFLTYEIVRNGDNSEPLTVHYKLVDLEDADIQTADYLANGATGTITIPAGESRVVLALETLNDAISGNDIEFKLQISAEGFVNPIAVNSKIVDDDSGISIVAPQIVANQDGTITYTFEVNRTGNLAATTVAWTLAGLGINAAASNDFTTEMAGNVVFAENDTSKEIVITVAADSIVENDENFRVTLVSSTDTTQKILVSSADAVIEDDDVISENTNTIQGGAGVDVIDSLGGDDIIHSGSGADVIHAGNGNDTIYTEGGADVVYAGAGDDNIVVDSLDFMLVDGGLGFDTLTLDGANMELDFASITAGEKLKSIEAIDLTGNGDNTLKLSFDDVFAINESRELYINGNSGDRVEIDLTGTTNSIQEINGTTYNIYEYNAEDEYAKILVEQTVTINLI